MAVKKMAVKWSVNELEYEISKNSKSNVVTSVNWSAMDEKEITKDNKKIKYDSCSHGTTNVDSDKIDAVKYKDGDSVPKGKKIGDVKIESKDPWKDNDFVAYDKLDEDTVIKWVKAKLGDDKVKEIEDAIKNHIDVQENPTQGKGKPW